MSHSSDWQHFFKPEVRAQGDQLFAKGSVSLANTSDTQVNAYVRTSSAAKVTLTADSIASPVFNADCNCPQSKKGQLCKHVWATVRKVEESYPDFFDSKTDIVKGESSAAAAAKKVREISPEQADRQKAFATKQADYRKAQYQTHKTRMKERRQAAKGEKASRHDKAPSYPPEIQAALEYFAQNGFPAETVLNIEGLQQARKILSRVFHPDKGGTHDEMLSLNENYDLIEGTL